MNRRQLLTTAAGLLGTAGTRLAAQQPRQRQPLDIADYQPKSMLNVPETPVERARFPVIDIHTHLSFAAKGERGVPMTDARRYPVPPTELLPVMDRRNLRTMVNLTGGYGDGLRDAIQKFDRAHPGRFITFTEPMWARAADPDYAKTQGAEIERAHRDGAKGLKVLKTLGLYLREKVTSGPLVKIDDRRFDPMWEACGALNIPVAIHVSDPAAFFHPTDRFNERFEELNNHPDWSFHGKDFPSNAELLDARDRVFARHPKTQLHRAPRGQLRRKPRPRFRSLDRFPNMSVEIGARIGELGRQPRTASQILRALPGPHPVRHRRRPDGLLKRRSRSSATNCTASTSAFSKPRTSTSITPRPVPPQGRWRIYGIGLPEQILRKVYNANAARLLGVKV
jgi:hypothetical protein